MPVDIKVISLKVTEAVRWMYVFLAGRRFSRTTFYRMQHMASQIVDTIAFNIYQHFDFIMYFPRVIKMWGNYVPVSLGYYLVREYLVGPRPPMLGDSLMIAQAILSFSVTLCHAVFVCHVMVAHFLSRQVRCLSVTSWQLALFQAFLSRQITYFRRFLSLYVASRYFFFKTRSRYVSRRFCHASF